MYHGAHSRQRVRGKGTRYGTYRYFSPGSPSPREAKLRSADERRVQKTIIQTRCPRTVSYSSRAAASRAKARPREETARKIPGWTASARRHRPADTERGIPQWSWTTVESRNSKTWIRSAPSYANAQQREQTRMTAGALSRNNASRIRDRGCEHRDDSTTRGDKAKKIGAASKQRAAQWNR